jgi:hypothetical protein
MSLMLKKVPNKKPVKPIITNNKFFVHNQTRERIPLRKN